MRVPPYNPDYEKAILGCMILNRQARKVGLELTPDDFYVPMYRSVFSAIERLNAEGMGVDILSVAEISKIPRTKIDDIQAMTPASMNTGFYVKRIGSDATARRAISIGEEISERGWKGDLEAVERLLQSAPSLVAPPIQSIEGVEASELAVEATEPDWLIPGVLERRDRVVLVGPEGRGKSELSRQIAVQSASGIHPFTLQDFEPIRVLIVDVENGLPQISRRIRYLLSIAGDHYRRTLWVKSRPQGLDLRTRNDARWLDGLCGQHRPDLLFIGPLYKLYRGAANQSKSSEESAEEVSGVFDEIRTEHDCALWIEAHAPHGDKGDRAGWRPRGSTLWEGWPEFGIGMKPVDSQSVELVRWRGDRSRDRESLWPSRLTEGRPWPWMVPLSALEEIA